MLWTKTILIVFGGGAMGDQPVRKWLGSGDRRSARWDGEAGLTSGSERERDREGMVFIQQQQRRSLQVISHVLC
jgi:hypothetical protein